MRWSSPAPSGSGAIWDSTTPERSWPASCSPGSTSSRRGSGPPLRHNPARGDDDMDPNRLTVKTQEALHDAQTTALRLGHTEVDAEHLLLALLDQRDGLIPRLLAGADVDTGGLRAALQQALERRPRVSGPGNSSQIGVTRALAEILDRAEHEAERLKD